MTQLDKLPNSGVLGMILLVLDCLGEVRGGFGKFLAFFSFFLFRLFGYSPSSLLSFSHLFPLAFFLSLFLPISCSIWGRLTVTGGRPRRGTVDITVGDGDSTRSRLSENDVLARDSLCGDVINPIIG